VVERVLQHPVRPAVPTDPLSSGPSAAVRDAARTGLYVHVPFCSVRCTYCHFSTGALTGPRLDRWFAALERECAQRAPLAADTAFTSVFFGGGTPSTLSSRHFRRLWSLLREHFRLAADAEVTLEANPETVKPSLLETWLEAGVNRLSMGAQSFDAAELRALGRVHGTERPLEAVRLAREAGMPRLSLDLMYGYPGSSTETFERTLDRAIDAGVGHLSAYAFIPESGTPMGDAVLAGELAELDDDAQADLHAFATARLAQAGLAFYETSNFARPGEEARHNLVYWLRRDHLALGPSAHGLWRGTRQANHHSLEDWAADLEAGGSGAVELEQPGPEARADETLMLALRLGSGLDRGDQPAAVWDDVLLRHGEGLAAAVVEGRLEAVTDAWRVPACHRFVADDIIAWIAARARPLAVDSVSRGSLESTPCPAPLSPAA